MTIYECLYKENAIGVHDDCLTMVKKRTQMVWPHLKVLWHDEDKSAGDSERSKKERNGTIWGRAQGRLTSIFEVRIHFFQS